MNPETASKYAVFQSKEQFVEQFVQKREVSIQLELRLDFSAFGFRCAALAMAISYHVILRIPWSMSKYFQASIWFLKSVPYFFYTKLKKFQFHSSRHAYHSWFKRACYTIMERCCSNPPLDFPVPNMLDHGEHLFAGERVDIR